MTNLDSMLKNRDITLPTKVHLVKAIVFLIAMYGCKSRTIKKVEHQRIDAFELWCWRRLLELPGLQEDQTSQPFRTQSLEGLILKVKLQYFGRLTRRAYILKRPDAGKD